LNSRRDLFVFRTDVHLADTGPSSWKGDYQNEICSNLEQVGKIARELKATAILDGGDFFHLKSPSRNSHQLVIRATEIHRGYHCPTFCIEGNHDITYNNLETITRQPLGVLYSTGVFKHLRDTLFEDNGQRIRVVGVPYSPVRTLKELRSIKKQPGDDVLICLVHALAAKDPPDHVEEFFGEPVFRYSDLVSRDGPDCFCFGHWHKDQGVEEIAGKWFVNQGALSRGALSKENLERIPKATCIEVIDGTIRVVQAQELQVAPSSEVFDLVKKDRQDREQEAITKFVQSFLQDIQVDNSSSIETQIKAMGFAVEVQEMALEYLMAARKEN
jgi:DNA repair exonuclease SbcCD nuclease subunit